MPSIRDRIGRARGAPPLLSRRSVITGAGAGGALALGWALWPREYAANVPLADGESLFNAFIKIGRDGQIAVIVPQCEMGQGITTLIPQIIADELGADWRTVAVESAPINPVYTNTAAVDADSDAFTPRQLLPDAVQDVRRWVRREYAVRHAMMLTVGSTAVMMWEQPCRAAAAAARAMLMMAAARRWDADWTTCDTAAGFVVLDKRKLAFGELAAEAAKLAPPAEPLFRNGGDDSLYGQGLPRLDTPSKLDGSANYAGDIRLPGLTFAAIRQGPLGDSRLTSIDRAAGARARDVLAIVENPRWFAVVARNWWAANRALDLFAPTFTTPGPAISTPAIHTALASALNGPATRVHARGDTARAFAGRTVIRADYRVEPALHAPIETRTATAVVDRDTIRVWAASQAPAQCRDAIARATGRRADQIILVPVQAGGSFDAALDHSAAMQAAQIALATGQPVQLCWSRAEEIMRDIPRPPAHARLSASLNRAGGIDALNVRIAVPPVSHEIRARLVDGQSSASAQRSARGASDTGAVGGVVSGAGGAYRIPHLSVDHASADIGLPTGRWRGHADSYTAFFVETFVDELAEIAGSDPLSYRMAMLGGSPELANCLITATTMGGWEGGQAGMIQGLACHSMAGSHIALLATARPGGGGIQVEQLVAVVDCGRIVNPEIARQQIEGGLIFGLAASVGATTAYRGGVARARRLAQLGLPRLGQCPQISVELVDSDRAPGGVEELAVPVVAPAIANALFAATGNRIRRLPLRGDAPRDRQSSPAPATKEEEDADANAAAT